LRRACSRLIICVGIIISKRCWSSKWEDVNKHASNQGHHKTDFKTEQTSRHNRLQQKPTQINLLLFRSISFFLLPDCQCHSQANQSL
jgi:hypothetical protein